MGLQVFAGYGYSREYPLEKLLRDARIYSIFEGTNQVQRQVIGKTLLGWGRCRVNILVCIKQVPDTTEIRMDPKTNTLIRAGVPSTVNPFDKYALEAAVQLREALGGTVTAMTMGPAQAA